MVCLLWTEYSEEKNLLTQPRKKLLSSYFLKIGTIITPLLLFYPDLMLVRKNFHRSAPYKPMCFSNFVQSAVNARKEENEHENYSFAA